MIEIGKYNSLRILRASEPGIYLVDEDGNEVLLPNKYVPEQYKKGDLMDVFIYKDSEDRPVATTLKPKAIVGEYVYLQVKAMNNIGAFMDWGLEKDLLVPFKEQNQKMNVGHSYIVYVYLDSLTERIAATSKYEKHLEKETDQLDPDQKVELFITEKTELGFKCIIDNRFLGLIYHNEIFQEIKTGNHVVGYVQNVRDDGKVDVALQLPGYDNIEPNAQRILDELKENQGKLSLNDKSAPEEIKRVLGVSKKVFKKAIGLLYKKRLITITDEGIQLNN